MLYAAARDDVKRALEPSRFTSDYHATDADSLAYGEYTTWRDRSDRHSAMSEVRPSEEAPGWRGWCVAPCCPP